MSWIDDLQLPPHQQDPLPNALIHRLLHKLNAHERLSGVMAAQAYQHGITTLALVVHQRGELTQSVVAGVLAADLLKRKIYNRLSEGNLLVVTHLVTRQIQAIQDLELDGLPLAKMWNVFSFNKYLSVHDEKPCIAVTNPGWIIDGTLEDSHLAVAVVDATHHTTFKALPQIMQALSQVRFKVVLLPPDATGLQVLGADTVMWFWNSKSVTAYAATLSRNQEAAGVRGERRLLVCDDDPTFDQALMTARQNLLELSRHAPSSALGSAWGVYHRLRQLAVPLSAYETAARHAWPGLTLREQLLELETTQFPTATGRLAWMQVCESLLTCYARVHGLEEPAKFLALAQRIESWILQVDQPLTVVAPSRLELPLLRDALLDLSSDFDQAEQAGRLEFIHAREDETRIQQSAATRATLLCGSRVSRRLHLDAYAPIQPELLLYPHEVAFELASQVRYYQSLERWQTSETRRSALAQLELLRPEPTESTHFLSDIPPRCEILSLEGRPIALARFADASAKLSLDSMSTVDTSLWFTLSPAIMNDMPGVNGVSPDQVVLHFLDGKHMSLLAESRLPVFSPHGVDGKNELRLIKSHQLRSGQQVVLMVDDIYDSLYDRLLEALGRRTSILERTLLALWEKAKRTTLDKHHGNRTALYQTLVRAGLKLDYSTVVSWFRESEDFDSTDPQQYHDFALLAQESGVYTPEQTGATFRAIAAHRTRQRVAGRHLHQLLRHLVTHQSGAAHYAEDLDSEVAELFNAVQLRTIARVQASSPTPLRTS